MLKYSTQEKLVKLKENGGVKFLIKADTVCGHKLRSILFSA